MRRLSTTECTYLPTYLQVYYHPCLLWEEEALRG